MTSGNFREAPADGSDSPGPLRDGHPDCAADHRNAHSQTGGMTSCRGLYAGRNRRIGEADPNLSAAICKLAGEGSLEHASAVEHCLARLVFMADPFQSRARPNPGIGAEEFVELGEGEVGSGVIWRMQVGFEVVDRFLPDFEAAEGFPDERFKFPHSADGTGPAAAIPSARQDQQRWRTSRPTEPAAPDTIPGKPEHSPTDQTGHSRPSRLW